LILSAFGPELVPLRRALRHAGIPSSSVACVAAGIGAIDAGVGAARAIAARRPRLVLFIGTAGTYVPRAPLGGVAIARRALLASTAVAQRDGYLPAPMVTQVRADTRLHRALLDAGAPAAVSADVATPLAITTRAALARRLAKLTGAAAENLEVFAVARAAQISDVPFGAVLGLSNVVGPRAHADWLRHQAHATQAASEVILAFLTLTSLAPKSPAPRTFIPNRR
jgi:purine-nucleoside phosphorylase